MPGTKCATHVFSSMLQSVIYIHGHCQCGNFHSGCQERNVISRCCKVCCPTLLVSSIPATVAAFILAARNEMCHTYILLCIALSDVSPGLPPMWHLWFLVRGTKCNIQVLWSHLPCVISLANPGHRGRLHSWSTKGNVTFEYYKWCPPALMVSSIPASVAAFIPCARNERCHTAILLAVALSYLYLWLLTMWHLSFLVLRKKCNIEEW